LVVVVGGMYLELQLASYVVVFVREACLEGEHIAVVGD
jgi:hypothetical protein